MQTHLHTNLITIQHERGENYWKTRSKYTHIHALSPSLLLYLTYTHKNNNNSNNNNRSAP